MRIISAEVIRVVMVLLLWYEIVVSMHAIVPYSMINDVLTIFTGELEFVVMVLLVLLITFVPADDWHFNM